MIRVRFRLRTIMIVVAFVALVLTVVIQSVLLHRARAAHRQKAAVQQQIAVSTQYATALTQQIERTKIEMERRDAEWVRSMGERKKAMQSLVDDLAIEVERTRGGFNRSIRKLEPAANETDRQGSEND